MDRATQTATYRSAHAHAHSFHRLGGLNRLFKRQSRGARASVSGSVMRMDESLMASWSVLHYRLKVAWCATLVVAEIADLCLTLRSC